MGIYDIFEGIYSKYASDATLSGLATGMYPMLAPEDATFPYITYHLIADGNEWDFGPVKYETPLIQFSMFSNDIDNPSEILLMWSDLTALYDDASLSVDDYTQVYFERVNTTGPHRIEDEEVLIMTCDFEGMFQEN